MNGIEVRNEMTIKKLMEVAAERWARKKEDDEEWLTEEELDEFEDSFGTRRKTIVRRLV